MLFGLFIYFWLMEKNEYELVVSQGKRPIWQRVLAAFFFTVIVYLLFDAILLLYYYGFNGSTFSQMPKYIKLMTYSLAGGVTFSTTKTVLIDVDKDRLVSRFCIGPFSRDVHSTVPELDYISVFLDGKGEYQVNLWYVGNKHYNMFTFEQKPPAMEFATLAANKLKIDLLDATEKGNSKWTEQKPS